jgi:CheY-like chemotaxis protein
MTHMTADTVSATLRVLVVEDDLGDVALVEGAFAEHLIATDLRHAANGAEALAYLRAEGSYAGAPRPDLILLDLNMPRLDGRQLLQMIKTDALWKTILMVVFTTSSTPADIATSYRPHANAYVTKPIDLDDFDRVMAAIRNFYGHTVTLPCRTPDATRHDGSTGELAAEG